MEKYKIKFQVVGSQSMRLLSKETAFHQDKESAIKEYEIEATKYVQLGIHHMYYAEILTCTVEHDSIMSREVIVDYKSDYKDVFVSKA